MSAQHQYRAARKERPKMRRMGGGFLQSYVSLIERHEIDKVNTRSGPPFIDSLDLDKPRFFCSPSLDKARLFPRVCGESQPAPVLK